MRQATFTLQLRSGEGQVTSKHDGKRARENMWVTHQNLARAKGGRAQAPFKPRAPKGAKAAPKASTTAEREPEAIVPASIEGAADASERERE